MHPSTQKLESCKPTEKEIHFAGLTFARNHLQYVRRQVRVCKHLGANMFLHPFPTSYSPNVCSHSAAKQYVFSHKQYQHSQAARRSPKSSSVVRSTKLALRPLDLAHPAPPEHRHVLPAERAPPRGNIGFQFSEPQQSTMNQLSSQS